MEGALVQNRGSIGVDRGNTGTGLEGALSANMEEHWMQIQREHWCRYGGSTGYSYRGSSGHWYGGTTECRMEEHWMQI